MVNELIVLSRAGAELMRLKIAAASLIATTLITGLVVTSSAQALPMNHPNHKAEQLAAKTYALSYMSKTYGWGASQFSCLNETWTDESHWNYRTHAGNSYFGIPQLGKSKFVKHYSVKKFMTDPQLQVRVGLKYINDRYGSPCGVISKRGHHNGY